MSRPLCGIPRAAALCEGAELLYILVGAIHGVDQPEWATLSFNEKHLYYREMEDLVAQLAPLPERAPSVTVVRPDGGKVVGRITPRQNLDIALEGEPV